MKPLKERQAEREKRAEEARQEAELSATLVRDTIEHRTKEYAKREDADAQVSRVMKKAAQEAVKNPFGSAKAPTKK
jgi:hypothetical protein